MLRYMPDSDICGCAVKHRQSIPLVKLRLENWAAA